jgi:glucan 1,3-beta-glucosidase
MQRYDLWDEDMKSSLQDFARAQMDAFQVRTPPYAKCIESSAHDRYLPPQNWFYWTWKTTPSSRHFPHLEANPLWSYSLGVRQGWLPRDPRDAEGFCFSHPRDGVAEPRRYSRRPTDPWKVGKAGMEEAGPIPPEVRERDRATWPPLELNPPNGGVDGVDGAGPETANLPVYERGRENATPLRGPVGSRKVHGRLDWVQPIEGCDYPDAWGGVQDFQGASRCTAAVRGVA